MTVRIERPDSLIEGVLPLLARVEPVDGETLLSLLSRAAEANVFIQLGDVLSLAGLSGHPAFAPFTLHDPTPLARLLRVESDEIGGRLHRQLGTREQIDWAGARMDRRLVEARRRRVSPASLRRSSHHRLAWTNRALTFCPETFERLISTCPVCDAPLGWRKTAGPERCEHCRADLREASTKLVPAELQPCLDRAAALISHDVHVRATALEALPHPFEALDPGDAFVAIVELGTTGLHPEASRGSEIARALSEGRTATFTEDTLARGIEIVRGWPDSFGELLERIEKAGGARSQSLRDQGLLGRWLDVRRASTPFGKLLRDAIVSAGLKGGAAVKLGSLRHLETGGPSERLTLTQAQAVFELTKATLGRLVPDGESCIGGRLGRGGGVRLDPVRTARAVTAYKASVKPQSVANRLGVPAYMLEAFAEAGLLQRIDDRDAQRLAGSALLFEATSLSSLIAGLNRNDVVDEPAYTLSKVLARRYSPEVWVAVFQAIRCGRLDAFHDDFRGGDALTDKVVVCCEAVDRLIRRLRRRPIPTNVIVNGEAAARLIGIAPEHLPELIEAGLIKADRNARGLAIRLSAVVRFAQSWIVSTELSRESGLVEPVCKFNFPDPDVVTRHLTLWLRRAVRKQTKPVLPTSPPERQSAPGPPPR